MPLSVVAAALIAAMVAWTMVVVVATLMSAASVATQNRHSTHRLALRIPMLSAESSQVAAIVRRTTTVAGTDIVAVCIATAAA